MITLMIAERGALVTDEDFDVVLTYLVKKHGRVHVNDANPEDIAEVLDIPVELAGRIVKHRGDVGKFKDFDALLQVPGLDRHKLEGKRDAILF